MIRDPLYRDILAGLERPLHEEVFERCAQALLRPVYPTLVPIRGGRDGGMDGLTADLGSDQIVLVATAGERVKRNLQASLNSMLESDNPCRRIISATSQKLSPERQSELREAATELGFRLVHIHEQAFFADALYYNPEWRKELLGLTGEPPPLSALPFFNRPRLTTELIGRDDDAKWLADTGGDRLLIGQPGTGKSFLLSDVAWQKEWLFVVSKNTEAVADGIRKQQPKALIVDDAHSDLDFLRVLAQLRSSIAYDGPIIATSWPGGQHAIAETLHLTAQSVRELQRLTRPETAQVLESAGLRDSDRVLFEILNQADGRPELAVTLAHLCINGNQEDFQKVVLGDALLHSLQIALDRLVGQSAIQILALLSIGGRAGLEMRVVADYLRKPLDEVQLAVIGLAAGGVIFDIDGNHLSVCPPELRYSLIRNYFFTGAISLDPVPLLAFVPSLDATTETLIDAKHYGASIPDHLLQSLLLRCKDTRPWKAYAWLGPAQAKWVSGNAIELDEALLQPMLIHASDLVIPQIFREAIGDDRPLHAYTSHPLRRIEDWIIGCLPR